MALRLLLREHPRSFALAAKSHTLIFCHNAATSGTEPLRGGSAQRCIVELSSLQDEDLAQYRDAYPSTLHGTLGLIGLGDDVFLCVISGASRVAVVRPGETVEKITGVEFCK